MNRFHAKRPESKKTVPKAVTSSDAHGTGQTGQRDRAEGKTSGTSKNDIHGQDQGNSQDEAERPG